MQPPAYHRACVVGIQTPVMSWGLCCRDSELAHSQGPVSQQRVHLLDWFCEGLLGNSSFLAVAIPPQLPFLGRYSTVISFWEIRFAHTLYNLELPKTGLGWVLKIVSFSSMSISPTEKSLRICGITDYSSVGPFLCSTIYPYPYLTLFSIEQAANANFLLKQVNKQVRDASVPFKPSHLAIKRGEKCVILLPHRKRETSHRSLL